MNYRLGYVGTINGTNVSAEKAIDLFNGIVTKENVEVDYMYSSFRKINYKNDKYLIFEKDNEISIYKILPFVVNDNKFIWEERMYGKIRMLWCQLHTTGDVRFNIGYYLNTHVVHINVMINKGNIDNLWLRSTPNNKDILDAINKWIKDFTNRNGSLELN